LHRGAWHRLDVDLKKLGRIGGKSLLYFEVISTLALVIGLVVVNVLKPGAGFHGDPFTLDPKIATEAAAKAHGQSLADFLLNIIPSSFLEAFVRGELLPVLFVALLTSFAISALGSRSGPVLHAIDTVGQLFFGIMSIIIKVAPIGAFGAMAFTIGSFGLGALSNLAKLMAGFYLTAAIFVGNRPGRRCPNLWFFDLPLCFLYQGRAPARARHQLE
jgi:aerobic C4-dicarboxylate transport protein